MELSARLRAFAGFVRRGSFSGAAEELRISQPVVSKHIADLEEQVGTKLVDRRKRTLTPAGEFLAGHVLRSEALLKGAFQGLASFAGPSAGSIAIIAAGTPGTYVLPDIIAQFQQNHPGIKVRFELATSSQVVAAVRTHRADVGVTGGFAAAPEIDAEPLIEDEIVIVGSRELGGRKLSRDELESMIWISREEGSATRAFADNALAELGIVPQRRLDLPAWEAIKIAVRQGRGVAAFSRLALQHELEEGSLSIIPFVPWRVRRVFSLVRIRDAIPYPVVKTFLDFLKNSVEHLAPGRFNKDF
jgi:DNA-binding transcriptional LysR family regulator